MKTFDELKEILVKKDIKLPLREDFYEYGEIADKKKFDQKDPEIVVKGVGKYKLSMLKKNIIGKLEDLVERAKAGEFGFVNERLNPKDILPHFVKAVLDVEQEITSPNMKRRLTIRRKVQDAKELKKKIINEISPPNPKIEKWILDNKARFIKEYGKEKGLEILYSKAWKMHNK